MSCRVVSILLTSHCLRGRVRSILLTSHCLCGRVLVQSRHIVPTGQQNASSIDPGCLSSNFNIPTTTQGRIGGSRCFATVCVILQPQAQLAVQAQALVLSFTTPVRTGALSPVHPPFGICLWFGSQHICYPKGPVWFWYGFRKPHDTQVSALIRK